MPPSIRTVPWLAGSAAFVVTAAVALRSGWIAPRVDPSTSPWIVGAFAACAAIVAMLLASRMGLIAVVRSRFRAPIPADECINELSTLAARASDQGVLSLAGDSVARRYPVFMSGLHLLCEDADRRLIRATLESQSEAHLARAASSRAGQALAVRAAQIGSALWLLGSLLRAAMSASSPALIGAEVGLSLFLSFAAFALSLAVGPWVAWSHRCSAADEFVAAASLETIMAIQSRDDVAAVRSRLSALLPEPADRKLPDRARLAA